MPYHYDPKSNLHGLYTSKTSAFYRCVGHTNFSRDVDELIRDLVLGLWQHGQELGEDHVQAINSLYSRNQPQPRYLYWELVGDVAAFKGIQIPDFFKVLAIMDEKDCCTMLIDIIRQILMLLSDPDKTLTSETEYISKTINSFNQVLLSKNPLDFSVTVGKGKDTNAIDRDQAKKNDDSKTQDTLESLLKELDSLVGLKQIKKDVKSLINLIKVRKLREENDLPSPPMSLHMIFTGNPGTGKTTVARLLARIYHTIGILSTGTLVEVDRSGLVAGYVGQTALKTAEAIKKAKGGILFIDEAYSLAPNDSENDFGREAIEIILKCMEDSREDLIVIAAGYDEPMGRFIASNPGLESRFGKHFHFSDYLGDELYQIFLSMCSKNKYVLDKESDVYIKKVLTNMYERRDKNFGNARDVRNLFERIISRHSDRIAKLDSPTRDDLMTFIVDDIKLACNENF
ncbi:MAG: AAA family ATPase [Clostridiales bacterium]|jgi:SpoVK/Ycf46/Vps4 family AAA+-type ATPase|nr:AAA family ATPase [Clostridiales bacterium]